VSKVEVATGIRLTPSSVEGFAIRVPRTRTSYFQDDIYPDTLCVEESSISAEQWLAGNNAVQRRQSLKPTSMKNCKNWLDDVSNMVLSIPTNRNSMKFINKFAKKLNCRP